MSQRNWMKRLSNIVLRWKRDGHIDKVCDEWREDREALRKWIESVGVKDPYNPPWTLRREDVTKGFNPENCYIQLSPQPQRIPAFGEVKSVYAWSQDKRCAISRQMLWIRWKARDKYYLKGWTNEEIISCRERSMRYEMS